MIPVHTELGRDLPELAWWHRDQDDPVHLTARFHKPLFDGWRSKPTGGLYTAVLRDFGTGLPDSEWAHHDGAFRSKGHRYVSTVAPEPDARFVVIDSQADGVAVAQAFPGIEGASTLAKVLGKSLDDFKAKVPDPSPVMAGLLGYGDREPPLVDFTLLEQHGYAGVYLTGRGEIECRDGSATVPCLWGWDVEQVWFGAPALRVTGTARWDPV